MTAQQKTKLGEASFDIQGEYISETLRSYVVEGRWDAAMRVLDGIDALSAEDRIDIIKGKATMVGWSSTGVSLVETDPKDPEIAKYLQDLSGLVDGVFRYRGSYYKPYGEVTSWSVNDFDFARKNGSLALGIAHIDATGPGSRKLKVSRSAYYAESRTDLMVCLLNPDRIILCRQVAMPPYWMPVGADAAETVKATVDSLPLRTMGARANGWEGFSEATAAMSPDELAAQDLSASESERDAAERSVAIDLEIAQNDEDWARREAERAEYLADVGDRIKAQTPAQGGWLQLKVRNPETDEVLRYVQVPRNPFIHWSLRNVPTHRLGIALPEWSLQSDSGLKMLNDDPYHTDWMLGAGLSLERDDNSPNADYGSASLLQASAYRLRVKMVAEYATLKVVVLAGKGSAYGTVVHAKPNESVPEGSIAVVPHAGPEYQLAMESACAGGQGALICATGGRLAHLSIVGRELGCRVVLVQDAVTKFTPGMRLRVDCDDHTVTAS